MKILYVLYHEYERMPIHAVEVIEEMNRQQHRVTLLTAISKGFVQKLNWSDAIPIHRVPILNCKGFRAISFFVNSLTMLPFWCLRKSPDVVYERFSLTSLATLWVTRLLRIPLVLEINGIVGDELALSETTHWRLRLQKLNERWVLRGADHLIAVTEGIRQWIASEYSVPLEKIDTIHNGTNPSRFQPRDRDAARRGLGLDSERPVVGYLGSLFPWCGLELLVDASPVIAARIPEVLFLIGGGQEEMKLALERRVKDLAMERHFSFRGEVPWDQAALFVSAFDVAVAPAQFSNPRSGISPQKVYAYLACERPVVGSDLPGLGNMLVDRNVGLSFQAGKYKELATAVVELLEDRELATSMGKRGRKFILECHTWKKVVEETAVILQRCFNPNSAGKGGGP